MEIPIPRTFRVPTHSFFLFGPRGTGKSTLLRQLWKDALWVDLLEADIFRAFSARPERLRDLVLAAPRAKAVVIDEIQKVPQLLPVIHGLIEKFKQLQFVLTGSSARKLKRSGVDLLAGRVIKRTLHPFTAGELRRDFDLDNAMKIGLVPLVVKAQDPEAVLKAYAGLYVREEVQAEGLVRNIGGFARFLEAVSFSHASVLTISNVARECEIERKVVEGYLSILEDLLLSYRIPVFTKKAKRATVSHPKFFFFDAGVFRSLRPSGPLDHPENIAGPALEGIMAHHLIAWNAYHGDAHALYYWRTRSGVEVDLVLYGPRRFWAIEVKHAARIRPADLSSLVAFREEYPESQAFLLYRGKERLRTKGVLCLPCEDFLREYASSS